MSFIVDALSKSPEGRTDARRVGTYPTHEEAVAAAQHVVDAYLFHEFIQGIGHGLTAEKLLLQYRHTGEVPIVMRASEGSTDVSSFDHMRYAAKRCAELFHPAKT